MGCSTLRRSSTFPAARMGLRFCARRAAGGTPPPFGSSTKLVAEEQQARLRQCSGMSPEPRGYGPRTEAIEHVPRERVSSREQGVAELTGVRHFETLHDRDRAGVRRNGERHDLVEFSLSKPKATAIRAASVAYPLPQTARASRQPISMHGVKGASKVGSKNPTYPINGATPGTSTAHDPKPRSANSGTIRSRTNPSDCARVSGAGKYSITRGSAFNSATAPGPVRTTAEAERASHAILRHRLAPPATQAPELYPAQPSHLRR